MNQPLPEKTGSNDVELELLVAYLDGELGGEETRQIESRLATDPAFRARLHELQSTWEMLDSLPRRHAPGTFAQSTVEMIALTAGEDFGELQAKARRRQLGLGILGAGGMIAAALVGFLVSYQVWAEPNRKLLKDLPLVENLDMYRVADSVEFLRDLEAQGLFTEADEVADESL